MRLDLEIRDGEFVSLLGPSGCGKTTTLRMIAGFIDPTAGTIEIDGRVLSSPSGSVPPEKRAMSMIFQSYAIWPNMTVGQNVAFGLELRKLPREETAPARVAEMLDVVHMGHLADRYPAELSGGQQQRVALARAIVSSRRCCSSTSRSRTSTRTCARRCASRSAACTTNSSITTVYVTHDQAEAMVTSDRIAVMNKGRIEQVDAPYDALQRGRRRALSPASSAGPISSRGRGAGRTWSLDGFAVAADRLGELPAGPEVTFSVRPQSLYLVRGPLAADQGFVQVAGTIAQRTFLGEHWDYLFAPDGSGLRLRVAAPPSSVFEVGAPATLAVDPALMIPIQG